MARTPTPRIDVPSREEFDALAARVSQLETDYADLDARVDNLEADGTTPPIEPPIEPPVEPPVTDLPLVQSKRVADAIELFGINTFSSLDENNIWGSWPANYSPDSVIRALRYLTGDTNFQFMLREYHYSGREDMQRQWTQAIKTAFPATKFSFCIGANGSANDVPSMLSIPDVTYYEGLNEPNTDFGSGEVPVNVTMDIQRTLWNSAAHATIMGPSVVAGMPHPEGWITGYFGSSMDEVNSLMSFGNGHFYPPHCPDLFDGASVTDYVGGLWTAYAQHPIMLTEFHPTLYNSDGHGPAEQGWNGTRDAYYTLLTLLRSVKCGVTGLWWYALFDYGTTYTCGLFPQEGANEPRPAATALRNLCRVCADPGASLRTFSPASLPISVDGPDNTVWDWDLYQSTDGKFFIPLWHSAPEPGGAYIDLTVSLAKPPASAELFDLLSGNSRFLHPSTTLSVSIPASVNMLVLRG